MQLCAIGSHRLASSRRVAGLLGGSLLSLMGKLVIEPSQVKLTLRNQIRDSGAEIFNDKLPLDLATLLPLRLVLPPTPTTTTRLNESLGPRVPSLLVSRLDLLVSQCQRAASPRQQYKKGSSAGAVERMSD